MREDDPTPISPTPAPAPPGLEYAPADRARRRWRRRLRWLAVLTLLAAAALAARRWGEPVGAQAGLLWAQHRCSTWSEPPDRVAYEHTADGTAPSIRPGGRYGTFSGYPWPANAAGLPLPRCWLDLRRHMNWSVAPDLWPNLFLHRLRAAGGQERVVQAALTIEGGYAITCAVVRPAPLRGLPHADDGTGIDLPPVSHRLRVFAGQADPADPSHFTIAFEADDVPGTIDGRLRDDGTLVFSVRPPR